VDHGEGAGMIEKIYEKRKREEKMAGAIGRVTGREV
jgi:hypothetical protein